MLIDGDGEGGGGGYTHSTSVLRLFRYMGVPYAVLGFVLLLIPAVIRDLGYSLFAKNRGKIWKGVKKVTGMGDTMLIEFRDRVVGLEEPLDPGWGFGDDKKEEEEEEANASDAKEEGRELKPLVENAS